MNNKIYQGDSLEVLKTFPDECIDCVVTSPPYWGLRDYGTAKWEGGDQNCDHVANPNRTKKCGNPEFNVNRPSREETKTAGYYADVCPKCGAKKLDSQLGLEQNFNDYITKLCNIFDEIKRVLKSNGTIWVNLGDTYSGNKDGKTDKKVAKYIKDSCKGIHKRATIIEKCLCQIPSRFAIEMTNRGWILRNEIIWYKPNCMPASVKDRFTVDFEKLLFFTKSKKYYFEQQFEPLQDSYNGKIGLILHRNKNQSAMRTVQTKYFKEKYGDSGTSFKGHSGYFKDDGTPIGNPKGRNKRCVWKVSTKPYKEAHFATYPPQLIEPCIKAGCPENGVVLDPFMGAGTTCVVAKQQGKNYIGIELNQEYIKLAEKRIQEVLI